MKKKIFGRQFKRDANERKALFKGLMNELVLHERITTTEEKAKAVRGKVEKLVTKAKRRNEAARQFIQPYLSSGALEKVVKDLAPRFSDRPGGYTRIIKIGRRFSDNASMAIIEWVEKATPVEVIAPKPRSVKEEVQQTDVKEAALKTGLKGNKAEDKSTVKKVEAKKEKKETKKK